MTEMKANILVVDDDPYVRESVSLLLGGRNYSVITCESAKEAMEVMLGKNNIDIVLTDVRMPVVSGVELLEKIHALNPELPVILMTAYAELDVAVDAIKKGPSISLSSPIIPVILSMP